MRAWLGASGLCNLILSGVLGFTGLMAAAPARAEFVVPPLRGPVQDEAGILSGSQQQEIETLLRDIHSRGVAQVQVLILKTLDGEPIESASIKITDAWKLGDAKKDNGVLLLVAVAERKIRIEVGQGLEGDLPDVIASRIIQRVITPYFKAGQYGAGIQAGVQAIFRAVHPEESSPGTAGRNLEQPKSELSGWEILKALFILLIILIVIAGGGGGRRRGFMSGAALGGLGGFGGGGGGGGWSGGGGGFSGGGASGGW